jgi:predicted  nucleic acid-binding Zn-ribbon protein
MKKWIEDLLELQENDIRIRKLTTRLEMIPIEIKKINDDIRSTIDLLKKSKENSMSTDLEIKQVESEIIKYNEEVSKLQKQSAMVKKNDEYRALIKEINNAKKKISELETRELELMDQKDRVLKEMKNAERIAREKANTLKEEQNDLNSLEERLKKQISILRDARKALTEPVNTDVLNRYQRILNKGVGQPLVPVHDGICGNCHLRLTPQSANLANKGEVILCENCGHLLYEED